MKHHALFIVGPTASGKTALSEMLCDSMQTAEIINCDMGQLYTKLTIGTAKPDLDHYTRKTHLFNLLDTPEDFSAQQYAEQSKSCIEKIYGRGHQPLFVGGTLFYVKALFFALHQTTALNRSASPLLQPSDLSPWDLLNQIDPDRARELHPHDLYRVNRALHLWESTGQKPSSLKPTYQPAVIPCFVYIQPNREILKERINLRTKIMVYESGWIEEAESLIDTPWEPFVQSKGLIGYTDLIDWIKAGKKPETLPAVVTLIQQATWHYAKRQMAFWKKFALEYQSYNPDAAILQVDTPNQETAEAVLSLWNKVREENTN